MNKENAGRGYWIEVEKSLRRIIDLANRIKRETIEIDPSLEYIRGIAEHIKEETARLCEEVRKSE